MNRKVSVAPMMDCTDRHERYFLRLISKNVLLYTEMIVSEAIDRGDKKRLLEFNIDEKIISEIENKVKEQVEEATEISKASPIPDVKEIFTDVWADGGYKWHN